MVRSIGHGLSAGLCQSFDAALSLCQDLQKFKANRVRQSLGSFCEMGEELLLGGGSRIHSGYSGVAKAAVYEFLLPLRRRQMDFTLGFQKFKAVAQFRRKFFR